MTRQITYVTGTRADFGLIQRTLTEIDCRDDLSLALSVTGMHLSGDYGSTIREIEAARFRIRDQIPVPVGGDAAEMGAGIGTITTELSGSFAAEPPDLVLLLGDRGEMLAGAIAGLHAGAAVVHIHGGERSGTVDEPVRHAISKLSHYHLTATEDAAERLRQMGEDDWRIRTVGAPGLDDLSDRDPRDRAALCLEVGLDPQKPIALVVFHPVVQQANEAGAQMTAVLEATAANGMQLLLLAPNADAGGRAITNAVDAFETSAQPTLRRETHLPRRTYLAWLAAADIIVGNSSSGIIESASLGTPCMNIGDRQIARVRNDNVVDVAGFGAADLSDGIRTALKMGGGPFDNRWGDGQTAPRIADFLAQTDLGPRVFSKLNSF
jgi:GDP/UDP-N,N'-diacetylbacillosamine 2-epimerase (hydrolysing)